MQDPTHSALASAAEALRDQSAALLLHRASPALADLGRTYAAAVLPAEEDRRLFASAAGEEVWVQLHLRVGAWA